jgi:hypothetical protein
MVPEKLANEPFCAVSHNGAANFSGGGNPEPRRRFASGAGEYRHEPAAYTASGLVGLLKVGPATDMLVGPKGSCAHS